MASVSLSKNFKIGHYFCNIKDSNLIFGMHVYLMELHILSGERSRSSFKVKGQKNICIFFMSTSIYWGTYCFCSVCWSVCWSVGLFAQTLTLAITFSILKIAT